ncbi:hypothetical protein CAEBREN_09806 [Caenorhabditis brenneri]|uniref:F-box domain-containing protein n=1 Tax=Caenorhabditis brenneri TaxID=135651 RepID=G0MUI9_CAEBE|nr:hypothetical protein CAEBREN_09806 [Caenorhabditis brenneri]
MQTFNLMGLPSLAFVQVIKKCDIVKIIELTIASKRFKRKVQEFKLKVFTLTWKYPYSMEIFSPGSSARIEFFRQDGLQITKINGTLIRMASDYSNPHYSLLFVKPGQSSTWVEVQESVTTHLLSIFRVVKYNFELRSKHHDIRSIYIWKYCRRFNNFDITDIQKPRVSLDEMTFLSKNINAEYLYIRNLKMDFRFGGTFNCKHLEITNPLWATTECLNSDHYEKIKIHVHSKRSFFFFNRVLKSWMKGGHEHLEMFYAGASVRGDAWRMLEGIEHTPTCFSNLELQFRSMDGHPTDNAVDFRRPTDGRLATLLLDEYLVLLLVWHEKHFKFVFEGTKTKLRKLKLISE